MLLGQNLRVGAMRAACDPDSTASNIAAIATTVFPGTDIALEEAIHRRSQLQIVLNLVMTRCCARVRPNGSAAVNFPLTNRELGGGNHPRRIFSHAPPRFASASGKIAESIRCIRPRSCSSLSGK